HTAAERAICPSNALKIEFAMPSMSSALSINTVTTQGAEPASAGSAATSSVASDTVSGSSASQDYEFRFGGIRRLYGQRAATAFRHAHVVVVGVGGVGSWTVESLARSGIGKL